MTTQYPKKNQPDKKSEGDLEDMDHDSDSDRGSGSSNDEETFSDMEENELDKRRTCLVELMVDLERQFIFLRDLLHREKCNEIDDKLFQIRSGRAQEYLIPLQQLQENMKIRTEVATTRKIMATKSVKMQMEAEEQAAEQNLRNEQLLLKDSLKAEIEGEIRRLEEERNNIDISTALWGSEKPKRGGSRRKPVTVTGPYIVYMLTDDEILQDLTIIKKALAANRRKQSGS